jgi:hypothetical protein
VFLSHKTDPNMDFELELNGLECIKMVLNTFVTPEFGLPPLERQGILLRRAAQAA